MQLRAILSSILLITAVACNDEPGGGGDDGARDAGAGVNIGDDGGGTNADGGDGSDGGDPLMQPREEFCEGEGTVVLVGTNDDCAEQIAEDTFRFGICACESIAVGAQISLDAFDSTVGPYGGTNVLDDGSLGINGALAITGKLTARGSAFVHGGGFSVGPSSDVTGTVYANGDAVQSNASTHIGRNAFFAGDVSGRFIIDGTLQVPATSTIGGQVAAAGGVVRAPVQTAAPCACRDDQILDVAALTTWAKDHNDNDAAPRVLTSTIWQNGTGPSSISLPCGRYYVTSIQASNGLSIRAEGRVVLFVDGDMTIDGPLDIGIADGGEVDLFVRGNLAVSASARFGSAAAPAKVRTYVGGSETIDLAASTVFGGNLYAPRALVRFGASAELFGALFARAAEFSGSADVHFDSAVRSKGDDCDEPDAGVAVDAGPALDAGPSRDAGVRDAGPPEDGCNDDLDCPSPQLCIDGTCQFPF